MSHERDATIGLAEGPVPVHEDDLKKLACVVGGGALGALLLKNHYEEQRKSHAEKDDPDGVRSLCEAVGVVLSKWRPRHYETEDGYTDSLARLLARRLPEMLDEDDETEFEIAVRQGSPYGTPDILINDRLVLELKVAPNKSERDRLVGQCCGYSQEWVTWAIVIDMPSHRVRELEELLEAKSLHYIEVIPFD